MKLKNTFGEIEHTNSDGDVSVTANSYLRDMKEIYDCYKLIKKGHANLKKWKKAVDAGIKTQTEYEAVKIKIEANIAKLIEYASGYGLGIGQGDEGDYEERGVALAKNIIDDATN